MVDASELPEVIERFQEVAQQPDRVAVLEGKAHSVGSGFHIVVLLYPVPEEDGWMHLISYHLDEPVTTGAIAAAGHALAIMQNQLLHLALEHFPPEEAFEALAFRRVN